MSVSKTSSHSKSASTNPKRGNPLLGRWIFWGIIGLVAVGFLALFLTISLDLPSMAEIENPETDLSTQLISADGVVLEKYFSHENRVAVSLDEISPYVPDALIATEDARFYNHSGIDPQSFFSIIYGAVVSGEIRGGSTITMQLSRNLYKNVGQDNKYFRKLKEFVVSAYLERHFTKAEIMQAYLNTVNIYGNSYGIETTSNRLFDKPAKDLTVEEAALLVGMLKGQGVYNPFRYPERTQRRRNTIINQMVKYGVLDSTTVNVDSIKAISLEQSLTRQEQLHVKGLAPYFRSYAREQLKKWLEEYNEKEGTDYNLYTSGLRVITTIDSRMQAYAEQAVTEHLSELQKDFDKVENKGLPTLRQDPSILEDAMKKSDRWRLGKKAGKSESDIRAEFNQPREMIVFSWEGPKTVTMTPMDSLRYYARFLETGMVAIEPQSGAVKAWVGGIDYAFFKYDHVAQGKRQVGSTFKPFVYAAAIDNDYNPCQTELNQPVFFENVDGEGTRWAPKNSGGEIGGIVTLREGLANSMNLITARLIKKIRPEVVAKLAYRMGIQSKLNEVPSLALGTTDLSVLELTNAYATIVNQGDWIEPVVISRIEDKHGKVLHEFVPKSGEALSADKAYMMIDLLKGVVDQGTAQRLRYTYKFTNEIGGKTGTTQDQSDGWFMGITPHLAAGVWVGHSDRRMHFQSIKYGQGANMALPIWALFMKKVYASDAIAMPQDPFPVPEGFNLESLNCDPVPDSLPSQELTPIEDFGDGF